MKKTEEKSAKKKTRKDKKKPAKKWEKGKKTQEKWKKKSPLLKAIHRPNSIHKRSGL